MEELIREAVEAAGVIAEVDEGTEQELVSLAANPQPFPPPVLGHTELLLVSGVWLIMEDSSLEVTGQEKCFSTLFAEMVFNAIVYQHMPM